MAAKSFKNIKKDFPIFANRKGLVYLDSASTSQKPKVVIQAESEWYEHYHANTNRGAYRLSEEATGLYELTRQKVSDFINSASPKNIVFTKGATEAINLVAQAWAKDNLKKGDVILLTEMEHHANLVPWQVLARQKGLRLRFWPIDHQGLLVTKNISQLMAGVKFLSLTHVSNVLGTINPVIKITKEAGQRGIKVLVDSAQAAAHLKIDVRKINPDFLVFSAHKMLGPTGVGVLYIKPQRHAEFKPYQTGGDMVREVSFEHATFEDIPWRLEAGTQSLAQVYALGKTIDYLKQIGLGQITKHQAHLVSYAYFQLAKIKEVKIYGPSHAHRAGLISFTVAGIHAHDLATMLDRHGVAIRAGHHCAMPLHEKLGVSATARISFQIYNDKKDIDQFIEALKLIIHQWQKYTAKK